MSYTGYFYAIGAAITWGLVYVFDQKVLKSTSPFTFIFIDAIITVIILLPVVFLNRGLISPLSNISGRTWIFLLASLVLALIANFFIFSSIKIIGASNASIFEIAYPFFVVLFGYFAFGITPNIYFFVGGLLIFSGAMLILVTH